MRIILMRHYKVAKIYKSRVNSREFDQESLAYNMADVYNQKPIELKTPKLYASEMKRAQLTAAHAFGRKPEILAGVYEITMKSYTFSAKERPCWQWEMMARLHWRLNRFSQYETKKDTYQRLNAALDFLENQGLDATIVMHGMAMRHLSKILKKRGYKGKIAWQAKNGECFEYSK